ncbi:MAG: hypothetical protein GEV07_22230 [Streptosporangiales bacterium]|nr:hypothetical protein [Streptosporangiales bacterium]
MIVRISHDDQYEIADTEFEHLNELDDALQAAVDAGDEAAFREALTALLDRVREVGTKLPVDALVSSDVVLPAEDADLAEVAETLNEEGLIPG